MRPSILFLKKVGLQKIVGGTTAIVLIITAGVYFYNLPKALDENLQVSFNKGEYEKSIPKLEKLVASNKSDVNALEFLAALYIQKASREPQSKVAYLTKANDILKNAITIDPQRSELYRLLGTIELLKGNIASASNRFKKAISLSGNSNANAQTGLALIYEFKNDWKSAMAMYKLVLEKDSTNEDALLGTARFHVSKNNIDYAKNEVQEVIASSTNSASLGEAYHILGTIEKLAKKPSTAKKYFEESLTYRPNNAHTLVLLGESYIDFYPQIEKSNRPAVLKQIIETTNTAVTLHPEYIHSYTLLYKVKLMQNKYDEANAIGKKIISLLKTDTTLTPSQKKTYEEYYSGEVTNIDVKSTTLNGVLQQSKIKK